MATKAQQFRAQQQRDANPPKPKQPRRPRRDVDVDTAAAGVSATDRKVRQGTNQANRSARAGRRGGAKLENSLSGVASRKSTRKSSGRAKRTTSLQLKA
ncbi:MAG: hypothetical protein ABI467_25300, partial [Kofleriaceae bacterium]